MQPRIQDLLIRAGVVKAEDFARALEVQSKEGGSIGRILADLGITTEEAVAAAIAAGIGIEFVNLDEQEMPAESDLVLPPAFCRERRVVPLGMRDRALRVAMADPFDLATVQDVEFRTSKRVVTVAAAETAIHRLLKRLYPELEQTGVPDDLITTVSPEGELEGGRQDDYEVVDPAELAKDVALPPIVRLVNMFLTDAAKAGASDVHVEPQETGLQVRQRVDGMLRDVLKIPKHLQASVVSRLKIISGMDIAERRKPQDGRSRLRLQNRRIDLRVSSLPTNYGEKVVVRLLDTSGTAVTIDQLGFEPDLLTRVQELLTRPQGMLLVTGPTGSGKTSTLYASLSWIKSPVKNIITVEDPIEYLLEGINQVQINARAGVTFATGLRSILRQDPNIVLVGEIRDAETAGIALEAAQTGHLILSTLHTNDAPSTITRLIDLGVEAFLIASSLIGILGQRLARRVCVDCAREQPPAQELLEKLGGAAQALQGGRLLAGAGCPACGQSGYRGRVAIHELLTVTDETRDLIGRRSTEHQLREAARRTGMRTLLEDGLQKVARGVTTVEEVLRVAPPEETRSAGSSAATTGRFTAVGAPAGGAQAGGQAGAQDRVSAFPAPPGAVPEPGREKVRVLVVEDSPTVVTVLKYFLENEGFEVLVAEDGLAGLDLARSTSPDVVVSDLNMPGLDGLSLVKALREDPRTRGAAILMLTSEGSVDAEERGLQMGADDYLVKPVEPKRLAARVKALLSRARGRTAASG